MKLVQRNIKRWQSMAFGQAAVEAFGVKGPYWVESAMMAGEPGKVFPEDRPHLIDRLVSLGQPALDKLIAPTRDLETSARWFRKVLKMKPALGSIHSEPLWRLLDPTPLTHLEWSRLGQAHMLETMARVERPDPNRTDVVWCDADDSGHPVDYYVTRTMGGTRLEFTRVLLQLRRWETQGELVGYYLNLVEAIECCQRAEIAPDLRFLRGTGADFLAQCFGKICLVHHSEAHAAAQLARLAGALDALRTLRRAE